MNVKPALGARKDKYTNFGRKIVLFPEILSFETFK